MKFKTGSRRYVQIADAARDARRWAEARVHYEAALAEDPKLDAIWVQLGHACKESGDLGSAEIAYRNALSLQPKIADTHLQLGHLLKIMARLDEAVLSYAEAVRLQPDTGHATTELATLGYTRDGMRVFESSFSALSEVRRGQGTMWFSLHATITGIAAAEVLRLNANHGLRLGCALRAGTSNAPVKQNCIATLSSVDETTLHGRFVLPDNEMMPPMAPPALLARIGFFYENRASFEASGHADSWMVIDTQGDGLAQHYSTLVASIT